MKKVRSSQPASFLTELNKTKLFPVSIVKLIEELLQLLLRNVRTSQTSIISGSVVLFDM